MLEKPKKKRRRVCGEADNFVRCLAIEFDVELGFRAPVVPVGKMVKLASSQMLFCERGALDGDAHARRLPGHPGSLCPRFGGGDAACDETRLALVFACEDEGRIACGDVLAAIHCFLRVERERIRAWITYLDFDRKQQAPYLARLRQGSLRAVLPLVTQAGPIAPLVGNIDWNRVRYRLISRELSRRIPVGSNRFLPTRW